MQWLEGDNSEDHASACFFNIAAAEYVKKKLSVDVGESGGDKIIFNYHRSKVS